jgi:hypothetical protein
MTAAAQVFDAHTMPFVFALEVFNPGHLTPHHTHPAGHELFYILSGDGEVRGCSAQCLCCCPACGELTAGAHTVGRRSAMGTRGRCGLATRASSRWARCTASTCRPHRP